MANKTIYIRDEDLSIFEKAQKLAEDSLSSLIMDSLKNFVTGEEKKKKTREEEEKAKKIIEHLLEEALSAHASAIFLLPAVQGNKVRFRIDGVLKEMEALPERLYKPAVEYIREMAGIEKTVGGPQMGKVSREVKGRKLALRVSILPSTLEESVTIRILDREAVLPSIQELEPDSDHRDELEGLTKKSHGLILVTGPTGSGKTTTIYAMLKNLDRRQKNVITIEDPVEALIEDTTQIPLPPKKEMGFPQMIRSVMEGDPDVLFIAEIRDYETAMLACQVALTGHLVFSILHTSSAAKALSRLVHTGVPDFMVRDAVIAVIAQRLVRKLCQECKAPDPKKYTELKKQKMLHHDFEFYRAMGCSKCRETGFQGMLPLLEVLIPNERIHKALMEKTSDEELEKISQKEGMVALTADGLVKASLGYTSVLEVLRVVS